MHDRRMALHARIVEAIEGLYADRLIEHAERLGHHALRGEAWDKALAHLRQAGAKASARSANSEAVPWFEQALTALSHLPETRETLEHAVDLRLDLRSSLWPLGQFERTFEYLPDAERLATTLEDPRRLGWVSVYLSQYFWVTGRQGDALTYGHRAEAVAETLDDLPLQVATHYYLGLSYLVAGDYRVAEDHLLNVIRLLEGPLSRERFDLAGFPAVMAGAFLTWALADRGEFTRGIAHGQDAVRLAETVDHPWSLVSASGLLGYLYAVMGDVGRAVDILERTRDLARARDLTLLMPFVLRALGYIHALSGRTAAGLSLLQQALGAIESFRMDVFHALFVTQLGEARLLAGELPEAHALAERALTLAREHGERGCEAGALRLLGDIAVHSDPPDLEKAEGYHHRAIALAEELGMRPIIAHCHLGLGKLYRRTGKREQAQEHLTTATTMYREMDMRFYLEQAEAEVRELT